MSEDKRANSQSYHTCDIVGCERKGRMLAKLGGRPIYYCGEHRKKYGERVIDALIDSMCNHKLSNFVSDIKTTVTINDEILSTESGSRLSVYIENKINELNEIEQNLPTKYAEDDSEDTEKSEE